MKITWRRWAVACVLASAFVVIALGPVPQDDEDLNSYRWFSQNHGRENALAQRQRPIWSHERGLLAEYASAVDLETASRVFSNPVARATPFVVWYATDVPEIARRTLSMLIERERSARGTWRGRGPVGVLVITDTATSIEGVPLDQRFDRDRAVTTAVLPASRATGDRCVTIIRLRRRVLTLPPTVADDHLPLDGCAFTDAFGTPGPKIAAWLKDQRYEFARRGAFEPLRDEKPFVRYPFDDGDLAIRSCRGGIDSLCVLEAMSRNTPSWWMRDDSHDRSLNVSEESWESWGRINLENDVVLETLERELGPARFQRMWQSAKSLPEAYFEQTGETLASWERARLNRFYGPYRIGPLPAPESNTLTIGLALVLAVTTIRFAGRPRVA
jgi:hypothetical protein